MIDFTKEELQFIVAHLNYPTDNSLAETFYDIRQSLKVKVREIEEKEYPQWINQ
jgi:hypothetical protein